MEFDWRQDIQILTGRVETFVRDEVIPLESATREVGSIDSGAMEAVRSKAREAKIYGPQLPQKLGGLGLNILEVGPIFEAAGRSLLGPLALNCAAPDEGNMHLLELAASPEQRRQYLERLASGEIRSAFAMTEPAPGAGSDPKMLQTSASLEKDSWVIHGRKWWVSGAKGAAFYIVMARTDPSVPPSKGSSMLLVPADMPGVEVVRQVSGLGASWLAGHYELNFEACAVPQESVLGEPGQGYALAQQRLGPARLTHCMRWIGAAQRALEIAVERANEREAFGSKLSGHQAVQWMLADSDIDLHAGRMMVYQAAWRLLQGARGRRETSRCKVFVAEAVNRVFDRAIQICGGLGVSRDLPLGDFFAEARAFRIYDGPSEVHRMVIARELLA
ncbi:MAG: acyl-CoA dehydrogenase family protein [Anaerolineales bacterium]